MSDTVVPVYKDKYFKGSLTDEQCQALEGIIEDYTAVTSLSHCIYDIKGAERNVINAKIEEVEEYEKATGVATGIEHKISENLLTLGTLTDEQTLGVAFMYFAKSMLLGDSVGKGKTVQSAGLYNVLQAEEYKKSGKNIRFLFLTEKNPANQLRRKLMKFTGRYVKYISSAEAGCVRSYLNLRKTGDEYSIVVGTHALLCNSEFIVDAIKHPYDVIIIDESSIVSNPKNDMYKTAKKLFAKVPRHILLNATPTGVTVMEFYWQLRLIDDAFLPSVAFMRGNFFEMRRNYRGNFEIVGYKNAGVFKKLISLRYFARARKRDNTTNTYRVVEMELSYWQKELMKRTSLIQMVCDYPTKVDSSIPFNEETTPKLYALMRILEGYIGEGERVLVYCYFVDCQEDLADYLRGQGYSVAVINGRKTIKVKNQLVDDFNNCAYDILITNVQKGLDIQDCDNIIIYSIDPNPQKMVQFEGRMTREQIVENKNAYILLTKGREKRKLETEIKKRTKAGTEFAVAENSLIIQAILSNDNRMTFDSDLDWD